MSRIVVEFLTPQDFDAFTSGAATPETDESVREALIGDPAARQYLREIFGSVGRGDAAPSNFAVINKPLGVIWECFAIYSKIAASETEGALKRAARRSADTRMAILRSFLSENGVSASEVSLGGFEYNQDRQAYENIDQGGQESFKMARRLDRQAVELLKGIYQQTNPSQRLIEIAEAIGEMNDELDKIEFGTFIAPRSPSVIQ